MISPGLPGTVRIGVFTRGQYQRNEGSACSGIGGQFRPEYTNGNENKKKRRKKIY